MRFTYLGFSQARLIALGLDDRDALILRYFIDYKDSGHMTRKTIDGEPYYWFVYDGFLEEYPLFTMPKCSLKKDTIYRRLKHMCKLGVLKHRTIRQRGTFSYYAVGDLYVTLISNSKSPVISGKEEVRSDSSPKGAEPDPRGSDAVPIASDSNPKGSDSNPKGSDFNPEGTDSNPEQRSFYYTHHQDPPTISDRQHSSAPSSEHTLSQQTYLADAADAINVLFVRGKRTERITPQTLLLICQLHRTRPDEVIKAVKAVIAQAAHNDRTGGEYLRNLIGLLKGRKNGDGFYHSYCFADGKCVLAVPELQPEISAQSLRQEEIDWPARFAALSAAKQAAYQRIAEKKLAGHKTKMAPEVYQSTLQVVTMQTFISATGEG